MSKKKITKTRSGMVGCHLKNLGIYVLPGGGEKRRAKRNGQGVVTLISFSKPGPNNRAPRRDGIFRLTKKELQVLVHEVYKNNVLW